MTDSPTPQHLGRPLQISDGTFQTMANPSPGNITKEGRLAASSSSSGLFLLFLPPALICSEPGEIRQGRKRREGEDEACCTTSWFSTSSTSLFCLTGRPRANKLRKNGRRGSGKVFFFSSSSDNRYVVLRRADGGRDSGGGGSPLKMREGKKHARKKALVSQHSAFLFF